jgi:hypothetical protein
MIILNKKRILFFCVCMLMAFGCLRFNHNLNYETVLTSATPATGYVVVLDAGHGQPDRRSSK